MRFYSLVMLFFGFASVESMDPPPIQWMIEFGGTFWDVKEREDGGFIVAGSRNTPYDAQGYCLFSFSDSGNHQWSSTSDEYPGGQVGLWVGELENGNILVAGACALTDTSSSAAMITKTDPSGTVLWTKAYDFPETDELIYCLQVLADGGFAVAGFRDLYPDPKQSFVMRLNSQGDSLWSYTCSESFMNEGRRVFEIDDGLLVFSRGADYPAGSVRLLLFSEADGSLLWEHNLPAYMASTYLGGDMTLSGTDNGYTFVTSYWPQIVHTDSFGNVLWNYDIPAWWQPYGHSINSTMDGGYIFGGENKPDPDDPESVQLAEVVKFDSDGNVQWANVLFSVHSIQSVSQLRSGGYIACGPNGLLLRYEPETGIEGSTPAAVEITSLSSNPFSESLTVNFNLSNASEATLSVWLVDTIHEGSLPAGEHSSVWVPEDEHSGCYVIRLESNEGASVKNCVLIR